MIRPRRVSAELISIADMTHDMREFRFRTQTAAEFIPGQYASIQLDGLPAPRCYSMSNLPNPEGEWHFQVRRVNHGAASTHLFRSMKPGDSAEIDAPFGQAYLREGTGRDIVCIAGGSGLGPMLSIARGAASAGLLNERKLYFFYGARTPRDICGLDFLRSVKGFGSSLYYLPVVSDAYAAEAERWAGHVGCVHEWVPRNLEGHPAQYDFYFAGPPPMTQSLQEMLMVTYQVPFSQFHFDRFFLITEPEN
jgi:toluene monooxygenase electron transfer component